MKALGKALISLVWRDLLIYGRYGKEWLKPAAFFFMVGSLFPLALGGEVALIRSMAPAVIWVSVVLALLMSAESVFRMDYQHGVLEQLLLSPYPLPGLVLAKSLAHWIAIGIPLLTAAPLLGVALHLPLKSLPVLCMTLVLGIPPLSLWGSVGSAITLGLNQGGLLLAILVLPFMIPLVIFATSALSAASLAQPYQAELYLLGAWFILTLAIAPLAISFSLKLSAS